MWDLLGSDLCLRNHPPPGGPDVQSRPRRLHPLPLPLQVSSFSSRCQDRRRRHRSSASAGRPSIPSPWQPPRTPTPPQRTGTRRAPVAGRGRPGGSSCPPWPSTLWLGFADHRSVTRQPSPRTRPAHLPARFPRTL